MMYAVYELEADQMWRKRALWNDTCPIPGTVSLEVEQYDLAPAELDGFTLGALYGTALIKKLKREKTDGVSGE
jgi:hypothetical protein